MASQSPSASSAIQAETDPVTAVARYLESVTGIVTPPHRRMALERELVGRVGPISSRSARDFVSAVRDHKELRVALVNEIAIPETYMFRHPGHFAVLEAYARERVQRHQSLRVLSAGCSSGEEAWSIAAVLQRVCGTQGKSFQVVGWDLDPYRLERARAGQFRGWSARNGLNGYDTFFTRTSDGYQVRPNLLPLVRLEERNLVMTAASGVPQGTFDVIFFRNVAIYWDLNTSRVVTRWLASMIRDEGLLMVGPSDPIDLDESDWRGDIISSALVYRRRSDRERKSPGHRAMVRPASKLTPERPAAGPGIGSVLDRIPPPIVPESPPLSVVDKARTLADAGQTERALKLLHDHMDQLGGEGRQLAGILLFSIGDYERAAERLRQAIFLMPDDAVSRRWLALALESNGRGHQAARERRALRSMGAQV